VRVGLVISSLSLGGAEKVMSIMANYWVMRDWDVSLITFSGAHSSSYALSPKVREIDLDLLRVSGNAALGVWNNGKRILALRGAIRKTKAEIAISFMDQTNVLTLAATRGLGVPLVVSERVDPRQHPIGVGWKILRSILYRTADALVVPTNGLVEWGKSRWPALRLAVIPNPVLDEEEGAPFSLPPGSWCAAMGRLVKQKGFDLLVRAFALASEDHPEWRLLILGEGEERASLEVLARELGVGDRLWMPGRVQQPAAFLKRSKIFALSSRYEGFPNALVEAMACGLPVISFDCPTGPGEIIRDKEDGILIPAGHVDGMASALKRLMSDENERKRLGEKAKDVKERFGVGRVMGLWEDLLMQVLRRD